DRGVAQVVRLHAVGVGRGRGGWLSTHGTRSPGALGGQAAGWAIPAACEDALRQPAGRLDGPDDRAWASDFTRLPAGMTVALPKATAAPIPGPDAAPRERRDVPWA